MDVRLSTLQILTQLILNDMIKVKGQISEIALCILDDDPSISYTAKMFFTEFARKVKKDYCLDVFLEETFTLARLIVTSSFYKLVSFCNYHVC